MLIVKQLEKHKSWRHERKAQRGGFCASKGFAQVGIKEYIEEAKRAAEDAKEYSSRTPQIIDGTWWVWNADTDQYEDTATVR